MALLIGNWSYNPTYRSYNPIYNWWLTDGGPPCMPTSFRGKPCIFSAGEQWKKGPWLLKYRDYFINHKDPYHTINEPGFNGK